MRKAKRGIEVGMGCLLTICGTPCVFFLIVTNSLTRFQRHPCHLPYDTIDGLSPKSHRASLHVARSEIFIFSLYASCTLAIYQTPDQQGRYHKSIPFRRNLEMPPYFQ